MSSEAKVPEWALGAGIDTDMTGDAPVGGESKIYRWWLERGKSKSCIFLTNHNEAIPYWEHNVTIGTKYNNFTTCLNWNGSIECDLCNWSLANNGKNKRYKVQAFTIIDIEGYTSVDGVEHKMLKRLLCAKQKTVEVLKRRVLARIESGDQLKGAMFRVSRGPEKTSIAVGDDWEFTKMVDLKTLEDVEVLDYNELLAPDPDHVKSLVAALKGLSGVEEGAKDSVKF